MLDAVRRNSETKTTAVAMVRSEGYRSYPTDVWSEILLLLPYKKLVQLKRVCKCWHELVSDEYFIRRHHDLHGTRTVSFVFSKKDSRVAAINYAFVDFDGDDGHVRVRMRPLPLALAGDRCSLKLHDSWGGLLLISQQRGHSNNQLFLYNPVTRTREFLPAHRLYRPETYYWHILQDGTTNQYTVIGLGPRAALNPDIFRVHVDPKCLMLQLHRCDRDYSRSSWKELALPEGPSGIIQTPVVRSNGKMYWLVIREPHSPSWLFRPSLLALDLAKQQFEIKISSHTADEDDNFSEHDGAFYRIHTPGTESELWVLRDLDAQEPMWLKLHVIRNGNEIDRWVDWNTQVAVLRGINKLIVFNNRHKREIAVFDMISEEWAFPNVVGDEQDRYRGWGIIPGPLYIPQKIVPAGKH